MKRTLSLILALAMIMSLFTTVSFAAETLAPSDVTASTAKWPHSYNEETDVLTVYHLGTLNAKDITVSGNHGGVDNAWVGDNLKYYDSDKDTYYQIKVVKVPVSLTLVKGGNSSAWTHKDNEWYYTGTVDTSNFYVKPSVSGVTLTQSITSNILKVDSMTVTGAETANGTCAFETPYKVTGNTYYVSTPTKFSIPGKLDVKNTFKGAFGTDLTGTIDTFTVSVGGTPLGADKLTYYTSGDNIGTVLCKDARVFAENIDNAKATVTANGKTLIMPLTIDKSGFNVEISITNGGYVDYTGTVDTGILNEVEKQIKKSDSTAEITSVTLSKPDATDTDGIIFYKDAKASADSSDLFKADSSDYTLDEAGDKFSVVTTPGTTGERNVTYTASASNGKTYVGTITFKSVAATAKTDTQSAAFFYEWSYMDSISGVEYLDDDTTNTAFDSDTAINKYYDVYTINPTDSGKTADWTKSFIGYTSGKVAFPVTVTYEPVEYDILSYVEDGISPFNFEAFELFAERVASEQEEYHDIAVDYVTFPTVSGSKWDLEKGGKAIKSSDKFTSSTVDDVYLDVTVAGYYDIPFKVHFDYKKTSSSSWTTTTPDSYKGLIRVYAGDDGDIKYEVVYGETVSFDTADFAALYKKLEGSTKKLETVTVDALPIYGALYRNSKVTSAYAVDEGDLFYADPSSANSTHDLDKVTYWASKTSTTEYSVYIPVTMDGTGGECVAVVEILVKNGIPFKDIAKSSTFYEYIQYAYNNGIMGGKSETNFDAKSNITRAQLVVTLYRMDGSPSTYNGKVLPYTDTKYLNTEFSNALKWATAKGIATGYGTNFNPNSAVTRQAMVTILYRYAKSEGLDIGVTASDNLAYFNDGAKVSSGMKDAMNWAVDYGFVSGNGSMLNPGGSTTRGAAAKILSNFHAFYIG